MYLCHLDKLSALQTVVWRERACTLVVQKVQGLCLGSPGALSDLLSFTTCAQGHILPSSCPSPTGLPYSKAVLKILVCSLWMNPYLPPPQSWVFHISRSSNGSIWINCLMEIKKLFVFCLKQTQLPWREDVKLLPNHPPANLWHNNLPHFYFFTEGPFVNAFPIIPLWKKNYIPVLSFQVECSSVFLCCYLLLLFPD